VLGQTFHTPNAIPDGDFEDSYLPWTLVDLVPAYGSVSLTIDSTRPYVGCQAGLLSFDVIHRYPFGTATGGMELFISTEIGQTYDVGFAYDLRTSSTASVTQCDIYYLFNHEYPLAVVGLFNTSFIQFSTEVVAFTQSNLCQIRLLCTTNDPGTAVFDLYLDEVYFTPVADNPNIIVNGGFDNSATDPSPWVNAGSGSLSVTSVTPDSPPYMGQYEVTLSTVYTQAAPYIANIQQPVTLIPGVVYKVAMDYNITAVTTPSQSVYTYAAANIVIQYSNSSQVTFALTSFPGNVFGTFTATESSANVILQVAIYGSPASWMYTFDNVYLVEDRQS
jgi:hypothetical protein